MDEQSIRILAMLAAGAAVSEVARSCNLSRTTVWRRVDEMRRTWGLENTTQVVLHAVRRGLI